MTKEKIKQIIDKTKKFAGISGKKFSESNFLKLNDFLENSDLDFIKNEDEFEMIRNFLFFSEKNQSFSVEKFLKTIETKFNKNDNEKLDIFVEKLNIFMKNKNELLSVQFDKRNHLIYLCFQNGRNVYYLSTYDFLNEVFTICSSDDLSIKARNIYNDLKKYNKIFEENVKKINSKK